MISRVVLVGMTGFTGRLVAQRLLERGVEFTAAARDLERSRGTLDAIGATDVEVVPADLGSHEDVAALAKADTLVVNCVGPFNLRSRLLAETVARVGGTYVDVTGEEPFVAYTQHHLDEVARESGALLVHACAFESLPADLLAKSLCDPERPYLDISSFYHTSGRAISPGTRLTMRLASHWDTCAYRDGVFKPLGPGGETRSVTFPFAPGRSQAVFAPYPEIRFWPRRHETRSVSSFMLMSSIEATLAGGRRGSGRSAEEVVERHERSARREPTVEQRATDEFGVAVVATDPSGCIEGLQLTGRDPYGVTAAFTVWACETLLAAGPGALPTGVRGPSDILDASALEQAGADWGFDLRVDPVECEV